MINGPYLLDTSTLIWALVGSERLSANARKALKAVIKAQKGLLRIAEPSNWWSRATKIIGGDILSIRAAHISVLAGLPDIHKDPFDRMLIAQASAEGLVLVTTDEQ